MSETCPKCGAAIPPEAPQGLCPKCLLQQASFPTETGLGARHARAAPPSREELAQAFPNLEILELIGQGGMGFVFKARQPKLDRLVALKILAQPLAEQASFAERFTREGRMLAKLNHPRIVAIFDFGQAGPFFYLLMEFVDGVNLRQAMKAGAVNSVQALAIVPKICEALQFAHTQGILHRDIKPDNILIDTRGEIKIADFGIAKLMAEAAAENPLTGSGASLGTPHYMAPEQIERPNMVDHRADIYSLGVVFYEMLTGELPLGRFAPPSEKSSVDPRLDKVVFQTLEKEPERRPQSAEEVRTRVEDISTDTRSRKAGARNLKPASVWFVVGATVVFILLGALVLNLIYLLQRAPGKSGKESSALPYPQPVENGAASPPQGPAREIEIADIRRARNRVHVSSSTPLPANERIIPLIRYGQDPWTETDACKIQHTWTADRQEITYSWQIPEPFTPDFDVMAALQRARAIYLGKMISLEKDNALSLFIVTNGLGQTVSGGLRYEVVPAARVDDSVTAVITGRTAHGVGAVEGPPIMELVFEGAFPAGTWIEASAEASDKTTLRPRLTHTEGINTFDVRIEGWRWRTSSSLSEEIRKKFELRLNERVRLFTITNYSQEFRANDSPFPIDSIVSVCLELKRLPAITESKPAPKPDKFIDIDHIRSDGVSFTILTGSELFSGENLEPVTRYWPSDWDVSETVAIDSHDHHFDNPRSRREFSWHIPPSFSQEFDFRPALRRFTSEWSQKSLPLRAKEITTLFTMTNGQHQVISCGLRFTKTPASANPSPKARLKNFKLESGNSQWPAAHFVAEIPAGYRLDATAWLGGGQEMSSIRKISDNRETDASWRVPPGSERRTAGVTLPSPYPDLIEISPGAPYEVFWNTNAEGKRFVAQLELVDAAPRPFQFEATNDSKYIVLQSDTFLAPDEKLTSVIERADGNFSEAVSSQTIIRRARETSVRSSLMWAVPEGRDQPWIDATTAALQNLVQTTSVRIVPRSRQNLFRLSRPGAEESDVAFIRFDKESPLSAPPKATIRARSTGFLPNGVILFFDGQTPAGYRLEAECEPNEPGSEGRLHFLHLASNDSYSANWTFGNRSFQDHAETIKSSFQSLTNAPVELSVGETKPLFIFKAADGTEHRAVVRLARPNER